MISTLSLQNEEGLEGSAVTTMVQRINRDSGVSEKGLCSVDYYLQADVSRLLSAATQYTNRRGTRTQYIRVQLMKEFISTLIKKKKEAVVRMTTEIGFMEQDHVV